MRPFAVLLLAVLALLLPRAAFAAEEGSSAPPTVDLYTIGPSGEFPSRFGHVLLCVREAGKDTPEGGRCYDYGVPSSEDMVKVGWTAMRGVPSFIPIVINEPQVLAFFKDQGRQIEKQRLPLTPDETKKLVDAIELEVKEQRAYAYHPYWANCTTKIRDQLDAATNGRLRDGPSVVPPGTLREYMEEGHSGHLDILTAMALLLGEGNDVRPTAWQAMLLPTVLRDAVAERFHAPPEKLSDRLAVILPTSRAIGRFVLFFLAFALFVTVRIAARRGRLRLALGIVGGFFAFLALTLELAGLLVKWTEVSHNWALLLFLPTDLALPFLAGRRLSIYVKARMATAGLLAVLEVANVAHQPLIPLVVLVVLPLAGILSALKERVPDTKNAAPAEAL